jgi:type VI secretion system protein ImpA
MNLEIESLTAPLSADAPCGSDLEDTQLLNSFDAYRIFGSTTALSSIDWRQLREAATSALGTSRDLRLLAHLGAAVLRTDGLLAFFTVLQVADRWLSEYWDGVYPRIDDDAILRKNALNCLADRMAIVDSVRRAPFITHRQLGTVCLRQMDLANGRLAPTEADASAPNLSQIAAALAGTAADELTDLVTRATAATTAARHIGTIMQEKAGYDSAPDLEPLLAQLVQLERLLREHLATRSDAQPAAVATADSSASAGPEGVAMTVGEIKSRQDAVQALEAVAAYFRRSEPSSPVPLLLDRAKRLVSKSFLEVLEDIAPDSVTQVRVISGIKADQPQ